MLTRGEGPDSPFPRKTPIDTVTRPHSSLFVTCLNARSLNILYVILYACLHEKSTKLRSNKAWSFTVFFTSWQNNWWHLLTPLPRGAHSGGHAGKRRWGRGNAHHERSSGFTRANPSLAWVFTTGGALVTVICLGAGVSRLGSLSPLSSAGDVTFVPKTNVFPVSWESHHDLLWWQCSSSLFHWVRSESLTGTLRHTESALSHSQYLQNVWAIALSVNLSYPKQTRGIFTASSASPLGTVWTSTFSKRKQDSNMS